MTAVPAAWFGQAENGGEPASRRIGSRASKQRCTPPPLPVYRSVLRTCRRRPALRTYGPWPPSLGLTEYLDEM